jgi:hypothetical protein
MRTPKIPGLIRGILRWRAGAGVATARLAACVLAAAGGSEVRAQVSALGMNGAYSLEARGVEAPSWNPATLAWGGGTRIRFFSVEGWAANNSISLDDYNRWVGKTWSEADKREILSRIPGPGLDGLLSASVEGPGFAMNRWAFTTESRASADVRVPRDVARLLLLGNNPEESFVVSGSDQEAFAWSEARLSHGRELGTAALPDLPWIGRLYKGDSLSFAAGATVKYLQGWGYAELRRADGGVATTFEAITGDIELEGLTSEGGSGFGLDLGMAARSRRGWSVSFDAHNVASSIHWSTKPIVHRESAWVENVTLRDLDVGSDVVIEESTREAAPSFRRSLPALLTFAAGKQWRTTRVELDLNQGFADRPGSSRSPRIGAGLSYEPASWLDVRAGASLGGAEGRSAAMGVGVGLGRVRLDFALASVSSWNFLSPKGVGGGVALGWR